MQILKLQRPDGRALEHTEILAAGAGFLVLSIGPGATLWSMVGVALVAASFLLRWARTGHPIPTTGLEAGWACLIAGGAVGLWTSAEAKGGLRILVTTMASISLFYVAAATSQPRRLAAGAVLAAMALSACALLDYAYVSYTRGNESTSILALGIPQAASGFAFPRPFPNSVATVVAGLLPLAASLSSSTPSRAARTVWGVASATLSLAVLSTSSLGAIVALLVALIIWALARRRRAWLLMGGTAAVACAITAAGFSVMGAGSEGPASAPVGRVLALFDRPDRLEVYQGSLRLIQDFWMTGIGLGDVFGPAYSRYVLLIGHVFLTYSHNLYLSTWLAYGLLGIVGLGWLIAAFVSRVTRSGHTLRQSLLFQGAVAGVSVTLLHGLFDARQFVDLWTMWPLPFLLGLVVATGDAQALPDRPGLARAASLNKVLFVLVPLAIVGSILGWRPVASAAVANLGAVDQARAELSPSLPDETRQETLQRAITRYEIALALDADNRTANLRLGNLAVSDGDYKLGITHLEKVWQESPGDPTARKALGLACAFTGETDRAAQLLQDSKDIVQELNTWGWWHGENGRQDVAANVYRTSLALDASQPGVQEALEALRGQQSHALDQAEPSLTMAVN